MFLCDTASNIRVSVSGTVVRIGFRIRGMGYTNDAAPHVDTSELALWTQGYVHDATSRVDSSESTFL